MSSVSPPLPTGNDFEPPPVPVRRFSVDEYHRLIRDGYFDDRERIELLEGWIVPKMTKNPAHDVAIDLGQEVLRGVVPGGWRVRGQSAVTTKDSEPEPDLAVVRGQVRDYRDRHPGPGDMALVVEVADSSLSRDRGLKLRIYAKAGVPVYWIVNLVDGLVEVYTEPDEGGRGIGRGGIIGRGRECRWCWMGKWWGRLIPKRCCPESKRLKRHRARKRESGRFRARCVRRAKNRENHEDLAAEVSEEESPANLAALNSSAVMEWMVRSSMRTLPPEAGTSFS